MQVIQKEGLYRQSASNVQQGAVRIFHTGLPFISNRDNLPVVKQSRDGHNKEIMMLLNIDGVCLKDLRPIHPLKGIDQHTVKYHCRRQDNLLGSPRRLFGKSLGALARLIGHIFPVRSIRTHQWRLVSTGGWFRRLVRGNLVVFRFESTFGSRICLSQPPSPSPPPYRPLIGQGRIPIVRMGPRENGSENNNARVERIHGGNLFAENGMKETKAKKGARDKQEGQNTIGNARLDFGDLIGYQRNHHGVNNVDW